MSFDAIHTYYREVEKLRHSGGTGNEKSIRFAFQNLLFTYARSKDLTLVPELAIRGRKGKDVYPDGTLKDMLRQDWGYWESKDEYDDLELEITKKFDKGYPNDNILFEDGNRLVLFQDGREVSRIDVKNDLALDHTLKSFISYQRPEVAEFRKAIELFKADVPKVTEALRDMIINVAEKEVAQVSVLADKNNKTQHRSVAQPNKYIVQRDKFLALCKEVINPYVTKDDIREMVIQHILTADIFNTIFDEVDFHRENNIAKELQALVDTFFTREVRNRTLAGIKHYYDTINARAAQIADHHEKQMFLKVVYETFYKSYDPKKADRLGVVYTPNEIVRFMIDSTDYLLGKHFGKQLQDKNVEILDPATGTGTFICDIIDHISKDKLPYKYKHELHANEVEILPYYIANLNIEFTYKQKTGDYAEFTNLCFVDTLDNMAFDYKDKQEDIFSLTDENAERIRKQNERKISVIIGNPPYNANQMNENENNKNREYTIIDKRIKDTYIKHSTAQKTKVYDMYARFLRWASDRIDENGVIAFISNNSFINSKTFDGFRKVVADEFNFLYMINLKGNARTSGERRRQEGGNVFRDQIKVGIAIYFLIKKEDETGFYAYYNEIRDYAKAEEKIDYLVQNTLKNLSFEHIQPDKDNNWINLTENNWDEFIPVADKEVKLGKSNKAIFKLNSLGVVTARDEWVYDDNADCLNKKVGYLIDTYNADLNNLIQSGDRKELKGNLNYSIKWTRAVINDLQKKKVYSYNNNNIIKSLYRPFVKKFLYFAKELNEMQYQLPLMFTGSNTLICINQFSSKPFNVMATSIIPDYHLNGDAICISQYIYDHDGKRHDNITDWALGEFRTHYKLKSITKEDIFHYVYGVLHNPAYRKKYELNLKRSLPRIPYYEDFGQWAKWGKALMELHLNFETVEPYGLEVVQFVVPPSGGSAPNNIELSDKQNRINAELQTPKAKLIDVAQVSELADNGFSQQQSVAQLPKAKLKADKENGRIILDTQTTLSGIPSEAWNYKLGNRSALEWILDQYKEKKPKDPTIAKLFNTYKFADYKDKVIDLLLRVTTVSVETMKIVQEMGKTE